MHKEQQIARVSLIVMLLHNRFKLGVIRNTILPFVSNNTVLIKFSLSLSFPLSLSLSLSLSLPSEE
jgi:hypothetical protein